MLKTVHQCLLETDTRIIVDAYLAARPIDYEMIENKDLTLREIKERVDRRTEQFVEHMRTIEPDIEQKPAVFFAVPKLIDGYIDVGVALCEMEDLLGNGNPETYSWILSDQAKIVSCYIAETEMTNEFMTEVLAKILVECSCFGYDQKDIEKAKKELEEADKEAKAGKYYTMDELRQLLGLRKSPSDFLDEKAEQLKHNGIYCEYDFNRYCESIEIEKVRCLLHRL